MKRAIYVVFHPRSNRVYENKLQYTRANSDTQSCKLQVTNQNECGSLLLRTCDLISQLGHQDSHNSGFMCSVKTEGEGLYRTKSPTSTSARLILVNPPPKVITWHDSCDKNSHDTWWVPIKYDTQKKVKKCWWTFPKNPNAHHLHGHYYITLLEKPAGRIM